MKLIVVVITPGTQVAAAPGWDGLTGREREVASLVGRALTNQQIAHRLGISTHTVNYHLRRIFGKLGIQSRVNLAQLAQTPAGRSQSGQRLEVGGRPRGCWMVAAQYVPAGDQHLLEAGAGCGGVAEIPPG